jgi:hypothetical protein
LGKGPVQRHAGTVEFTISFMLSLVTNFKTSKKKKETKI